MMPYITQTWLSHLDETEIPLTLGDLFPPLNLAVASELATAQ
jgi:hypothetical protein